MTWFHGLQLAYWAAAVYWGARQMNSLLFKAPVSVHPVVDELASHLPDDPVAAARVLGHAQPAWIARVGVAYLRPPSGDAHDGPAEAQDVADGLRGTSLRGIGSLITMGRIASPLAFLGVIMELTRAFGGGGGLDALQRGLPEQLALGRAATGVTMGIMTMLCCFAQAQMLSRQLKRLGLDMTRTQEAIGRLEGGARME